MIQEEQRGGDGLSEEDVGLKLTRMKSSHRVARSWEEVSIDELPDFEGKMEEGGEMAG